MWRPAAVPGSSCSRCSRTCRGRAAGASLNTRVTPIRTACSTCSTGRCGTQTASPDDLREHVIGALGDTDAVLVVDERGDLKKGHRDRRGAAPVHRHRRSDQERPGRGLPHQRRRPRARGHAMIDRELYLPRAWIQDPERLQRAGVPAESEFATKPALATGMLIRAGRGCPGPLGGRR
ncbi:transposase [Streptomyces tendae]|uniref:transposase n=1 Tax=Streptomyces tendae TaxID=1932 RepID=UPI00382624C6